MDAALQALFTAVAIGLGTAACNPLSASPQPAKPSALARSRAARRPAPASGWAGPGRQRRTWPAQLHPGSGPRQRPRRP